MVHLEVDLLPVHQRTARVLEILAKGERVDRRLIGQRPKGEDFGRNAVEAALGDAIAREDVANLAGAVGVGANGVGIVDGNLHAVGVGQVGKVALPPLGDRHRGNAGRRAPQLIALVVEEAEGPVLDEGSTNGAAVLVVAEGQAHDGEGVARIQLVVAEELIQRAMDGVGTGLGNQIDGAAGREAEFRRHGAALHLELLHRVNGRRHAHFAHIRKRVVVAVEHLIVHAVR